MIKMLVFYSEYNVQFIWLQGLKIFIFIKCKKTLLRFLDGAQKRFY